MEASEDKKLEVRIVRGSWYCTCGGAMFYIDAEDVPQRRMQCMNKLCKHNKIIYLEPVFEVRSVT